MRSRLAVAPSLPLPAVSQAVEEVLPPAPTRFSGLLGGAWQKVRTMFRRSSGRADATEEEPEAESIGDYTASAVNPESYPASLPGDFRILPASAWQSLHALRAGDKGVQHRSCSHSSCQRALKPHESSCGGCRCSRPREIRGNGHAGH